MKSNIIKQFISGFVLVFALLMIYLIAVNFVLMFTAEGLGLYENIPLFIALAVFLNVAPFIILFFTERANKKKRLEEIREFQRTAKTADALVLEVSDTGVTINDDPMVRLKIEINYGSLAAFTTLVDSVVSRVRIPRVGDVIKVQYNPNDISKITVLY